MMLDLPQPFGPTTPTSCPGSMNWVGSANDLKPESLMEFRRTAQAESKGAKKRRMIGRRHAGQPRRAPEAADPGTSLHSARAAMDAYRQALLAQRSR